MKNIFQHLKTIFSVIFIGFSIISCNKEAPTPTDETKDRGHDMPDKVQFIITNLGTNEKQERNANKSPKGVIYNISEPIKWQVGHEYRFEIVYYNNNNLINHEFVSEQMAPIHQHFFQLYKGTYPKDEEGRKAMIDKMNTLVTYNYQDTDPENGTYGTQGVKLRLRSWDKTNPEQRDPIGLKGVFYIKETNETGIFNLRIKLAHFLIANKLNPKTKDVRPYNVVEYSSAFVLDSDMTIPIEIIK